ncbi:hypothetical protein MAR_009648 [Mya arenaria]|uniref:Uncharacterized protein n=1 Tax=Mya arenaria TaxID=6604 RepID=A0ABY7E009_MYAAR|nr:hypothetical protein MAR_009648 [Mya arenaria]
MVLVYDFIRSTALVLCIGYTSQQNRKTWMWGDSILWSAYCAGLFAFPGMLTLYFDFEAFGLLFLSSVYQFWRAGYRIGGREQKGNVSTVLRILFLICFTSGILNLTFPNWVIPLKKLDVLEGMMVRCCGVLLLSWAFISLYATSFRYDDDRSNFFVSAMISCGLMLASLNIAYFWDGVFDSQQALFMHIGCIPTFVVLVGLLLLWRQSPGTQTNYNLRSKSE